MDQQPEPISNTLERMRDQVKGSKMQEKAKDCLFCGIKFLPGQLYHSYDVCSEDCETFGLRKKDISGYLNQCCIPPIYRNCSKENFDVSKIKLGCQAYTEEIWGLEKLDGSIFISGPVGSGKTHLAVSLLRILALTDARSAKFRSATEIMLKLRSSFSTGTENDVYQELKDWDILLVDDIGAEKPTDYTIQAWYHIIDQRYSYMLPTIYTSNHSLKELSERLGERVASRLSTGKVIYLEAEDYRTKCE